MFACLLVFILKMGSFKRWDINLKNITGLPILVLIKRSGTRERRTLFSGSCFVHGKATFVFLFLILPAIGMAAASVLSRKGSCESSRKANAFQPQLALHLIHALFHVLTVGITTLSSGKPCYTGACVHLSSPVSLEEGDTFLPDWMGDFAF